MTGWPDGYGLRVLDEVDSTLSEAARIAPGLSGPVWILAHHQTKARGRRGRAWANPRGNLAATLVLFPKESPGTAALRSFVAALAVLRACEEVCGAKDSFALKWPNDVLLNGGKLAGILLESAGNGTGLAHLSIGIGVNLIEAPPAGAVEEGAVPPVSLLSETGVSVQSEAFLTRLAVAYADLERQFTTYGFAPVRTAWMARAARLGSVITARTARSETRGRFETVDAEGNLILITADGAVAIPAAEVYF